MAYKFNALTSQFDLVSEMILPPGTGDVIGPASSTAGNIPIFDDNTGKVLADSGINIADLENYDQTFLVSDWVGPASNSYSITILAATHAKTNPLCVLYELNGSDYIQVEAGIRINSTNDVIITVNDVPDNRFIGKIVIS